MAWPGQVGEGRVFHHESGPSQPGRRHGRAGMRGQHGGPGAVGSNGMPPPPFPHQRGCMLPPAPPASVVAARMRTVQAQVDQLIAVLEPCFKSEERRMAIFHHIRAIVEERFPCLSCHMMGSFPLKTYLPDSDLDMTICTRQRVRRQQLGDGKGLEEGAENDDVLVCVNEAICRAAISRRRSSTGRREDIMEIRSISLVNARTPVVNCLVQNVSVDITINQTGSLATLTFLEEVDRSIGNDHLFKRSLLLLKAWCLHESQKYVGVPILGSKANGGLTSYALSVMVLCLFTAFAAPEAGGERPTKMKTPFDVMLRFLQVYSTFDWSKQVLSLEGPVPIPSSNVHRSRSPSASSPRCRFTTVMERVREYSVDTPTSRDGNTSTVPDEASCPSFPVRICNIEDPLNPTNNLGYSLNRQSLQFLQHSIAEGRRHLDYLLSLASHFDVIPYAAPTSAMAPVAPSSCPSDAPQAPLARKPRCDSKDAAPADLPCPPPLLPPSPTCSPSLPPCIDPPPFVPAPFAGSPHAQAAPLPPPPVGPLSPGPPTSWMGISLVAAYFPRLVQLYQDPAARRSDLLNHPCESRTGMLVCDDASTGHSDNGRPKSFLTGDVNHFWYTLTTTVAERRRRRRTRSQADGEGEEEDEEEADGNERPLVSSSPLAPASSSTTVAPGTNCTNSPNSLASSTDCTRNCNAPLSLLEPGPRHPRSLLLDGPHQLLSKPVPASYSGACSTSSRDTVALTSTSTSSPCSPCSLSSLSSQSPPPRPLLDDDCHAVRRLSNDDIIKSAQRRLWARHHEQQHKDDDKGPAIMALQASHKACASPSPLASPPVEEQGEEEEDQPLPAPLPSEEPPTVGEMDKPSPDVNGGSASDETGEAEPAGNPRTTDRKDGEAATTPTVEGEQDPPLPTAAPEPDTALLMVKSPLPSPEQVVTAPPTPTTDDKPEEEEEAQLAHKHKSRGPHTCCQPPRKGGSKGVERRGRKGGKEGRLHQHHHHAPDCPVHGRSAKKEAVREVGVQVVEEQVRPSATKLQGPWTAVAWLGLCCAVAVCCLAGGLQGGRSASSPDKVALGQDEGKREELVHWIREDSRLCLGSRFGDTGDEDEAEEGTTPADMLSSLEVGPLAHGEGGAWFQWLKDGHVIAESVGRAEPYAIEHAGVADEGRYTLVLRNGTHEAQDGLQTLGSTWVRIARPPRIHFKPPLRVVLPEGAPLTLSIIAEGSPAPQLQWKLNGMNIDGATSATHVIPSVGASHMGTYTCEVWNMAGRIVWEEAVVAIGI